jgi:hypothetical protein
VLGLNPEVEVEGLAKRPGNGTLDVAVLDNGHKVATKIMFLRPHTTLHQPPSILWSEEIETRRPVQAHL